MNYRFITCLTLFTVVCMYGCNPPAHEISSDMEITIRTAAGDEFKSEVGNKEIAFLPYITNTGEIEIQDEEIEVAVIGKRVKIGTSIAILPIATLRYKFEQKEEKVILAIPAAEKHRSMNIDSYDALLTEYFATKQLIEYWYANRYGLGRVSNISWNSYK